jgi:hypothetical protein
MEVVPGDTASPGNTASPWRSTATLYGHPPRRVPHALGVPRPRSAEARKATATASVEKAHDRVRVRERSHNALHLTGDGGTLNAARR